MFIVKDNIQKNNAQKQQLIKEKQDIQNANWHYYELNQFG